MFAPIMGRVGTPPLPADVMMAVLVALLTLLAASWMLPLVLAAGSPKALVYGGAALCALSAALALGPLGGAYSPERPQRLMVFHTRRTLHTHDGPHVETFYWLPELDGNTPRTVRREVSAAAGAPAEAASGTRECARWVYCGAPYFLPVLSRVARGQRVRAPEPPRAELRVRASLDTTAEPLRRALTLNMTGPSHTVVILSPAAGARVPWCELLRGAPQPGPRWGARQTYFIALHCARAAPHCHWSLVCHVQRDADAPAARGDAWVQVSAAGHAMAGAAQRTPRHERLLRALPAWSAPTGWGVDLHLLEL